MRSFAKEVITQAAAQAGLPAEGVMDKPSKESLLLPEKRIQLEYMEETLDRRFKKVARSATFTDPETKHPFNTIRARVYKAQLTVRAEVKSNDEAWLESFIRAVLLELPHKAVNANNDLVTIEATRAVRGGFGSRAVEVFKKRSNALHIKFSGMICRDGDVPLITDVNLTDNLNYKE